MSANMKCGLIVEGEDIIVPLKESKVNVTVQGFIANVECQLTYENGGQKPIETSFVFPMDDMSAVYKFEAYLNKKHIVAECQDKKKAQETYKEAISSGHTAMLLSEDDTAGDIFECKLGNLPAGEIAQLTMCFVVELSVETDGKIRFTLPTVLNPRYSPDAGHLVATGSQSSPSQVDIKLPCKLTFAGTVSGRYKIKSISSAKDKMDVKIAGDKMSGSVTLDEEFKFDHDLSFDVIYDEINKPEIILESGDATKDGLLKEDLLMLNFYPDLKQGQDTGDSKREFIIVIDRSGSMHGHRIQKAKESLLLLLKSLPVGCLFNVVSFGSSYDCLFDKSEEYSEKTLKEGLSLQKRMDADMGGTEILSPLKFIYGRNCKQGYPRQIFLLTDGEVSNTKEVIDLVRKNKGNTRVFTFGIGDGVSTSLIKNVAKASNGRAVFIKDKDNMQAKVISAVRGSLDNCLTEVRLDWKIPKCFNVVDIPSEPPVIFHGDKLVLFALLKSTGDKQNRVSGSFTLKGMFAGKPVTYNMTIEAPSYTHPDLPIHRVAAKYQIKELEQDDEGGNYGGDGVNKDKIQLVSQSANIISKYTAFVGVDRETKVPVSLVKEPEVREFDRVMLCCAAPPQLMSCGLSAAPARAKKKSGFSFSLPKLGIGKKKKEFRSAPMTNMLGQDCLPQQIDSSVFSDESEDMDDGICGENKELKELGYSGGDPMMTIVSLQNFDGSWTADAEIASILKKDVKELTAKYKGNIWCTAIVLKYLEKNFASRKIEWDMIYDKAVKWMESQDKDGKTVNEILQEASVV